MQATVTNWQPFYISKGYNSEGNDCSNIALDVSNVLKLLVWEGNCNLTGAAQLLLLIYYIFIYCVFYYS